MMPRAAFPAFLLTALATLPVAAAESKVDAELLEFLGSLDGDEGDEEAFLEFVEQRPVEKPSGRKPETAPPAAPKQVKKP